MYRTESKDKEYCLSCHEPYAAAIIAGVKTVDVRSWRTTHRGRLLIHATLDWDYTGEKDMFLWMPILKKKGVMRYQGGIIGSIDLVEVVPYVTAAMFDRHNEYHRLPEGRWKPGLFGWVFENPKSLKFKEATGQQRLWKF